MPRLSIVLACVGLFAVVSCPVLAQTLTADGTVTISATVPYLTGSPAQVVIPSMASVTLPNASANVTITNEGTQDYEYFYEWCVMADPTDYCGSTNNIFYASASKLITVSQNWDTVLTATVPTAGTYYFKTTVYFGTNASSAVREFTVANPTPAPSPAQSSGGSTSFNPAPSLPSTPNPAPVPTPTSTVPGDFTGHGHVDASDFSVMLAYWGKPPPPNAPSIDLGHRGKIDAVDFSILLYLWGNTTAHI